MFDERNNRLFFMNLFLCFKKKYKIKYLNFFFEFWVQIRFFWMAARVRWRSGFGSGSCNEDEGSGIEVENVNGSGSGCADVTDVRWIEIDNTLSMDETRFQEETLDCGEREENRNVRRELSRSTAIAELAMEIWRGSLRQCFVRMVRQRERVLAKILKSENLDMRMECTPALALQSKQGELQDQNFRFSQIVVGEFLFVSNTFSF
jgi:hypothetical protein